MEWLSDNYLQLLSIVAMAYGLVRTVIAITPTKKDNEWVQKNVHPVILFLGKVFGLDLTQGRQVKDKGNGPSGPAVVSGCLLMPLVLYCLCYTSGCDSWRIVQTDPAAQLSAYQKVFRSTVMALNDLIAQKIITGNKTINHIVILADEGEGYLDQWLVHVKLANAPPPSLVESFSAVLGQLSSYKEQGLLEKARIEREKKKP